MQFEDMPQLQLLGGTQQKKIIEFEDPPQNQFFQETQPKANPQGNEINHGERRILSDDIIVLVFQPSQNIVTITFLIMYLRFVMICLKFISIIL